MPIRLATEADLPGILEIHNDAIINTTAIWIDEIVDLSDRQAWFREHAELNIPVFVADEDTEEGRRIAGFATYSPFRPRAGWRFTVENSVYIHPDFRGLGLGERLMREVIASAKAAEVHRMMAAIESANAASVALHAKLGFRVVGEFDEVGFKFDRWLGLTMMELSVDSSA